MVRLGYSREGKRKIWGSFQDFSLWDIGKLWNEINEGI